MFSVTRDRFRTSRESNTSMAGPTIGAGERRGEESVYYTGIGVYQAGCIPGLEGRMYTGLDVYKAEGSMYTGLNVYRAG